MASTFNTVHAIIIRPNFHIYNNSPATQYFTAFPYLVRECAATQYGSPLIVIQLFQIGNRATALYIHVMPYPHFQFTKCSSMYHHYRVTTSTEILVRSF